MREKLNTNIKKDWAQFVCASGGLLIVIGSYLPRYKLQNPLGSMTSSGLDDNGGVVTLILGIIILLGSLISITKPKVIPINPTYVVIVSSFMVAIFGVMDYIDLNNQLDEISDGFTDGSIGIGVYLVIIGGILGMTRLLNMPKKPEKTKGNQKKK